MADAGLSLDDIIKKKKFSGTRGRGRIMHRGIGRSIRPNGSIRGRGHMKDARFKIIEKNREKLTDARDKLAEIAKQSDARLKLDKIRASQHKKINAQFPKLNRTDRISLSTNKAPPLMSHTFSSNMPNNYMQPPSRTTGYRPPPPPISDSHYLSDMSMDYTHTDDYLMDSSSLRRTVNNEYAPTPPPPLPVFSINPTYNWVKPASSNTARIPVRKSEIERERDRQREYKLTTRSMMAPPYKEDWSFGTKSRNPRDAGVKSRLDSSVNKLKLSPTVSRPKASSSSSPQSPGYRIVVSNLQANVTQEDIKELFEDVGELLVSRLVRPGTAEVIYKTLKDATKAVETYHNRQLDGHPMKCLLVNPRSKNNPTGPAVRSVTESRRSVSSSYVQPSLGAVHRALFDVS
ncbi:polymerase delta-interacting protein 3-like isoform X2 [Pseudomyrmex gracilis]|uniref:polymerase delta-interacting protein 3-like isoform X2 n=1 Tax=Pseudomyrmex gracilis TaxID=219809 RepID=UPI00099562FF|nr:polymerase delta-interacting protein 3-like isoform X2 [Pseudomyrmex gracilis]